MKLVKYKDWFDGWKVKEVVSVDVKHENGYVRFNDNKTGKLFRCLEKDLVSEATIDEKPKARK